ncbi:VanW family protein [Paenibacillus sp. CAU 1782]
MGWTWMLAGIVVVFHCFSGLTFPSPQPPAVALTQSAQQESGRVELPPLQLWHEGRPITSAPRQQLMLPMPGAVPLVNHGAVKKLAGQLEREVRREPVNAVLDGYGAIVPEKPGATLDRFAFEIALMRYLYEGGPTVLEIPLRPIYPRVDSEILSSIKMNAIGRYTTYYNSRNANRAENIYLAAKALNNTVLFPGERFSFNGTVGQRTKEKGYQRAPVIVRGEMDEDIGGGICQVSSTLYNAADRAGLTITERYSHSRNVTYVPPGRDATVSWYGPDLAFRNPYNHPVLIRAYAGNGQMSVSIYSSDMLETQNRPVPQPAPGLPEEEKREAD